MKGIRWRLAGTCLLVLIIFSASIALGEDSHHGDGAPDESSTQDAFQSLSSGEDAQATADPESPEVATNLEIARKALEDEAAKGNIPADAVPSILNSLVPVVQKFVSQAEEGGGPRDQRIKVTLSPGTKNGTRDLLIEAAPTPGRETGNQIGQTVVPIPSAVVQVPDGTLDNLRAYQSFDKLDTLVNTGALPKTKSAVADRFAGLATTSDWVASFSPADGGTGPDYDGGIATTPRETRGYGMPTATEARPRLLPLPADTTVAVAGQGRKLASRAKGFSVLRANELPAGARVLAVPELPLDSALDAQPSDNRFGWRVYLGTLFLLYGMGRLYLALRSRRNA